MEVYKTTRIQNNSQLIETIKHIHFACHKLCKQSLGEYLVSSGNMGVFSQSKDEYKNFTRIREELTEPASNPDQKYYRLYEPIVISAEGNTPVSIYTHLYIRKPDSTPYGKYLGDVDFVLDEAEYLELKNSVINAKIKDAEMYDRPGWDTIQITDPAINAVAYVSTKEFAEKVRVKF